MTHPSMVKVNLPYCHVNSNVAMIDFLNDMEGVSSRDDKDGLDEVDNLSKCDNIRSSSLVNSDRSSYQPPFLFFREM